MRKAFLLITIVFFLGDLFAQAPQGINYQGVARDHQGKPLASQDISVRISILKNSADGETEFSETHELKTNPFGLFTLVIGKGTVVSGLFNYISWAVGTKWLQVELDPAGNSSFQVIGSQQLMSVPYALYAEYSRNGLTAGTGISIDKNVISNEGDNDNNASNELITGLTFDSDHKLKITDAGGTKEADLSSLIGTSQNLNSILQQGNDAGTQKISNLGAPTLANDAVTKKYADDLSALDLDKSLTNEIQDLNLTSNTLKVTNNASATSVDLSPYVNTDNQNLTNVLGVNNSAGGSKITNLGTPTANADAATKKYADDLDALDLDKNATNEIQDLNLTGNTLKITNNALATSVDLSPYVNTDNQNLTNVLGVNNSAGGSKITNLGTPTVNADAATKKYADDLDALDLDKSVSNEIQNLSNSASGAQRTINISGGSSTTIDIANDLLQVLTKSNDAGLAKITNLGAPTANTDATTKKYVDDLDALDLDKSITNEIQNLSNSASGTQRTINISGGTSTTIDVADADNSATNELQNLSQVLTNGTNANSAGNAKIINLGAPTANTDATTKKYVDDADAILASKIATTYAFKTSFSYTNPSTILTENNKTLPFITEDFDDFNVLGSASFTATEDGIYVFTIDGSHSAALAGGQLSLLYSSTKYSIAILQPWGGSVAKFNSTFMFKMTAGQTISLVGDNILIGASFSGSFFGYKL